MKFCIFVVLCIVMPLGMFAASSSVTPFIQVELTDSEKIWLRDHPTIRVGMDSEYAPYEWLDSDGSYVGMAVDYLHLLEKKLGVHFEIVKGKSWNELLEMAKRGEIDILTSIVQTPERLKYFLFSQPYRDTQSVIIDNGKGEFIGSLKALEGKRVALERGYFTQELIEKNYPQIHLVLVHTIVEALTLVRDGKADAYVGDMSAINFAMKKNGFNTLRFSGQTEFSSQHHFAFPKSHSELSSIITKAMASISHEESDVITSRWLGMKIEQGIKIDTILKYSTGILFLFLLFCYWYYRLHREIQNRKATEKREHHRNTILEMIAKMEPLPTVLESIIQEVEEQNPHMLCSILLLDQEGKYFSHVIAPRLPDFYNEAIHGVPIGYGVGSCGSAAYLKERVIVEDIATHPYWKAYKALAFKAGLHACWSEPLFSSSGTVLGTFAIYHTMPHAPIQADIDLINQSANLTSIAIEKSIAAAKLKESEALYRRLTEEVSDVIWRTDRNLTITYISPVDEKIRGYNADEVLGHHIFEMFTQEGIDLVLEKVKQREKEKAKGVSLTFVTFEAQHKCKDGRLIWGEIVSHPELNDEGDIIGFHGVTREITERKAMQDQVRQLAFYDALTKLPNRLLLSERLHYALAEIKRMKKHAGLMFLDLDNFKSLNDTQGHSTGDVLLCQVAERLKKCVREMDTVARFGGDEFVIILHALHEEKNEALHQAGEIAEKIRLQVSADYVLDVSQQDNKHTLVEHCCTVSIGVLVFDSEEGTEDDLLKRADFAMYQAKDAGKNSVRFYDKILTEHVKSKSHKTIKVSQ